MDTVFDRFDDQRVIPKKTGQEATDFGVARKRSCLLLVTIAGQCDLQQP